MWKMGTKLFEFPSNICACILYYLNIIKYRFKKKKEKAVFLIKDTLSMKLC